MSAAEATHRALARRLRALRENEWPDLHITQLQVAEALGGNHPLSLSLISSWESQRNPVSPPANRLAGYAIFFASRRSVEQSPARLLDEAELTDEERARRDRLHEELFALRFPQGTPPLPLGERRNLAGSPDQIGRGSWYFEDQRPITIVCAKLPRNLRDQTPYTDPLDPDYVRSYSLADLDALIELHGHVRAVNPLSEVRIRTPDTLDEDDFTAHLILLGGVDWNVVTRDIARRLDLPVTQQTRSDEKDVGCFVADGRKFAPVVETAGDRRTLLEDVAYFFRGSNPYNALRTVTLCNGMFGRGTYGAVRALTDARFRDRNEKYLADRFTDTQAFSILARVMITVTGETLTPDWSVAENRLHEWPR